MQNIYGAEYRRNLPDNRAEDMSKLEWAKDIGKYSRDQISNGCDWIHQQKINHEDGWQFMDIGRCIGAIKQANTVKAAHKPVERKRRLYSDSDKAKKDQQYRDGIAELKGIVG